MVAGEKAEQKTWTLEGHLATEPHDVTSLTNVIQLICSMWLYRKKRRTWQHTPVVGRVTDTASVQYRGLVVSSARYAGVVSHHGGRSTVQWVPRFWRGLNRPRD